jgi:hypothetical protein
MTQPILLKTDDKTFLDVIGNGKTYRVPPYQRDYSWQEEQWEDLWNDLLQINKPTGGYHYMGAVVVEAHSENSFVVIDGQQRIATLTILALAVIRTLENLGDSEEEKKRNRERATVQRRIFIGEKDPDSLLENSKLRLNDANDAFFQDYLVQLRVPQNPRGLSVSNSLLWECLKWFTEKVKAQFSDGESLSTFLSRTVGRRLIFIWIRVEDELNAYTVFETLNARGLELSSTDLLKNYLFSRVRVPSDLEALQRRWKTLISIVRQERFPDFLRYHLLCVYPQIRKQRLFKQVRDSIKTSEDIFNLMIALEARAELFAALSDADHEYWIETPDARPFIKELQLFKVRQMTPLLFAAWEKFTREDFVRVLKLVSILSFRYTVIGGLNTNALEPAYHLAAKSVLLKESLTPRAVFQNLKDIYVSDEKFFADFATKEIETNGQRKRLVKFILGKLQSDASGKHFDYETDPATIEHILPENPAATWSETFSPERQQQFVYRLGNLTLLEPTRNRDVGNQTFAEKIAVYRESRYELTSTLASEPPEEWTPAAIEARQRNLAARSVHLWRSDFADV